MSGLTEGTKLSKAAVLVDGTGTWGMHSDPGRAAGAGEA